MKKYLFLIALLGISVVLLIKQINLRKSLIGSSQGKDSAVSIILTGFGSKDDKNNYDGEMTPFARQLTSAVDKGELFNSCQSTVEGYIKSNKVVLSSTGMGKINTASCLTQLLGHYGNNVKEVIFVGIAGITPVKGGMLDEKGIRRDSEVAMLGDVCINSLAFDFDLQHFSSDKAETNAKDVKFWDSENMFSSKFVINNSGLAEELYNATKAVYWLEVPADIAEVNVLYHGSSRPARVWGLDECIEATGDLYWHDIYLDGKARETGADFMSRALGKNLDSKDILVVTSMEASSAGYVVKKWNEIHATSVRFAYVRSASNFDHSYLTSANIPALGGNESLSRVSSTGAVNYAIETASYPVLKMFELRSINIK